MWKYIIDTNEALSYIETLNEQQLVSIDTETRGLNPLHDNLLLVQFGYFNSRGEVDVLMLDCRFIDLIAFFDRLHIKKAIFHNAKFDIKFLYKNCGNWLPESLFDTMLAKMILTNGIRKKYYPSLADLTKEFFNTDLDKSIRQTFENQVSYFSEEQLGYAADDAIFTLKLYEPLNKLLLVANLDRVADLEFKFLPVVSKMELDGINFDKESWLSLVSVAQERADKYEEILRELLEPLGTLKIMGKSKGLDIVREIPAKDINLNAPAQVLTALRKAKINVKSTNYDDLSLIDHPLVDALLQYRKYEKRITTYGQSWVDKNFDTITGRVHTTFNQMGAVSGRLSSDNPNLQNIINPFRDPNEDMNYRKAFIASQ